jgi:hypothetical protein
MAQARDMADFATLEARVRATRGEAGVWSIGRRRLADYNARAALPLNRIGPVGRPTGEPPSGSSVISNS